MRQLYKKKYEWFVADMDIAFWDIESTAIPLEGHKALKFIHAIGVRINDGPVKKFTRYYLEESDGPLQKAVELINSADMHVTFNGQKFDVPVVERLLKCKLNPNHLDLFIVAKVIFSKDSLFTVDRKLMADRKELWGSFGLKAFGIRMGSSDTIKINSGTIKEQLKAKELLRKWGKLT